MMKRIYQESEREVEGGRERGMELKLKLWKSERRR